MCIVSSSSSSPLSSLAFHETQSRDRWGANGIGLPAGRTIVEGAGGKSVNGLGLPAGRKIGEEASQLAG